MDRNLIGSRSQYPNFLSLSARRAWIEIDTLTDDVSTGGVALRKESVDRNPENPMISIDEIVALRKESVDRNYIIKITGTAPRRRSPQGERG